MNDDYFKFLIKMEPPAPLITIHYEEFMRTLPLINRKNKPIWFQGFIDDIPEGITYDLIYQNDSVILLNGYNFTNKTDKTMLSPKLIFLLDGITNDKEFKLVQLSTRLD